MKPQWASIVGLILTVALTLFVLFGPSYRGGGYGEYKHMNAIQANGARALFLLIPVGLAFLAVWKKWRIVNSEV
jgi:hypothetical protein